MIHNRRVAAILPLHFGKDYLAYAMRSVADVVDEYLIMYSPVPNHGVFDTSMPCPDTRDELLEIAYGDGPYFQGDVVRWFDYTGWRSEGEQVQSGWQYTDAEIIVKLDADEIWSPGLLSDAIAYGLDQQVREIRVPLVHYWRSFHKAFTHDPAAPGRIYLREFASGETTYTPAEAMGRIQHFGYSLSLNLMRYKWQTHGHSPEFRRDVNWFDDIYAANRQYDCHPIGSDAWMQTEDVTPPSFLLDHPFARLSVIE
jgi:hypothetical protein